MVLRGRLGRMTVAFGASARASGALSLSVAAVLAFLRAARGRAGAFGASAGASSVTTFFRAARRRGAASTGSGVTSDGDEIATEDTEGTEEDPGGNVSRMSSVA